MAGRLAWNGVNCGAQDEPVKATWNGAELKFDVVLRPYVNTRRVNGQCGSGQTAVTMKRKPVKRTFEGMRARTGSS